MFQVTVVQLSLNTGSTAGEKCSSATPAPSIQTKGLSFDPFDPN